MSGALTIKGLQAAVDGQPILRGVDLTVPTGQTLALMGPNGSGKSTLSATLLGHPAYQVTGGSATWRRRDILKLTPDERARAGLFLAFQYPQEIPGVSLAHFLRQAVNATRQGRGQPPLSVIEFRRLLQAKMKMLKMKSEFGERYLNQGFSGGEKKRAEILQLAMLEPEVAILDETDSGLDIDALRIVADGVNRLRRDNPQLGVLVITHYQRILDYIKPDQVHVMVAGRIAESGGPELVDQLEAGGYDRWLEPA